MAKKKLPQGFSTWIEFHDYLKSVKPELFREKVIHFMQYQPNGQSPREAYSISIAALERLCWKEIESQRLSSDETQQVLSAVIHGNPEIYAKRSVYDLLMKLRKNYLKNK